MGPGTWSPGHMSCAPTAICLGMNTSTNSAGKIEDMDQTLPDALCTLAELKETQHNHIDPNKTHECYKKDCWKVYKAESGDFCSLVVITMRLGY